MCLAVNADNLEAVLDSDILRLIYSFLKESDPEIVHAGLTLLLNVISISSNFLF